MLSSSERRKNTDFYLYTLCFRAVIFTPLFHSYKKFQIFLCYSCVSKSIPLKTGGIIALTVGGIIAYSLFRKSVALGNLNFYPAGIKSFVFESGTPVITIKIAVQNTSNQDFTLHSMAGNLYANDTLIGNAKLFQDTVISRNSEGVLNLRIELFLLGVLNDVINALEGNSYKQKLELDATANIDQLQVPVNLTYEIG